MAKLNEFLKLEFANETVNSAAVIVEAFSEIQSSADDPESYLQPTNAVSFS